MLCSAFPPSPRSPPSPQPPTPANAPPNPSGATQNGNAHGTGIKNYKYRAGTLMLRANYVRGKQVRSEWFKPDGTTIQITNWVNESGEGIYLRQDGTIRSRMNYVNGIADGEATFYNEDGTVEKRVMYRDGSPVSP